MDEINTTHPEEQAVFPKKKTPFSLSEPELVEGSHLIAIYPA